MLSNRFFSLATLLLTGALAATLFTTEAVADAKPGIKWQPSSPSLVQPEQPHERPVLLRFFAKWCGPCRVMDAQVWPTADVVDAVTSGYIPVELDVDTPEAAALARQFNIVGVPTIIVLDREGKERARTNFMSPEETLEFLKKFKTL